MRNLMKPVCTPRSSVKQANSSSTSTKMKVYIRVRPFNEREQAAEYRSIVKLVDDRMLIFDPRENDQPFFFHGVKQRMRDITKKQNKEMQFIFDQVYGSTHTNENVFAGSICNILPALLEGYNCSVFVYGATGAGKTHTMLGNSTNPGIIYLTMRSLYSKIEEMQDKHFDIGISYLEIYNEQVHDLLNPSSGPLHLQEDPVNGVIVAKMKVMQIIDAEHLFELLSQGNANRTQHATDANAESSRSHAVFQVFIKIQSKDSEKVQLVKLSMIDLAGSERGAATNCSGLRFKEGSNINKSLLALGNCINNLADGVRHIPYRDSKLTRLLKDSLGGNCQTVMIACVGPTALSYEDTYNTLKYAARARTIKTKIAKTVLSMDSHIGHYKVLLQEMQSKISALEKEVEQWKQAAAQPRVGDLSPWIEKIKVLFSEKKSLHQEILALESKEKILKWRIKYKLNNAEHISVLNDSDDEEFNHIGTSVNRMEGTVSGLHVRILELWDRKLLTDEKIQVLHEDIEKHGYTDSLTAEILRYEFKISEVESNIQINHLRKLLNLIDVTNEIQRNIITKMTEQYNQHHILLRGFNKVTNSMAGEHKDLKNLLKGNHTISWEISPSCEIKKRVDMLTKFAVLSVDILHSSTKPCPLIIPETENESSSEDEVKSPETTSNDTFVIPEPLQAPSIIPSVTSTVPVSSVKSKLNQTFTRPMKSPRRIGRVTPLNSAKKLSMKENVKPLPCGSKFAARPYLALRKPNNMTSFKASKTPLAAKNKNV